MIRLFPLLLLLSCGDDCREVTLRLDVPPSTPAIVIRFFAPTPIPSRCEDFLGLAARNTEPIGTPTQASRMTPDGTWDAVEVAVCHDIAIAYGVGFDAGGVATSEGCTEVAAGDLITLTFDPL